MGQTAEELRQQLEQQRDSIGRDLVAIGDRVSPGRMVERRRVAVRQSFGRARDAVMGTADRATSATGDRVGGAAESVQSAASTVGGAVTGVPDTFAAQAQGSPLAAGLVALGAGALVGSLLPSSRAEQRAAAQVQPTLETAATDLGEQAQGIADAVKEQAVDAADRVKQTAQEAAESVKADAADATAQTADQAKAAAGAVQPGSPA